MQEELDCIHSIYEKEVEVVHHENKIEIICNVKSLIIKFIKNEEDLLEITIENAENAKTKMSKDGMKQIKNKLMNVHKKEANNMPIFQCISFIFTELIDDDLIVTNNKKKKKAKTTKIKNKDKVWWLNVGSRIEYKHKGKKWKNGAITKVSTAFKSTHVQIKYWKKPNVLKTIEMNKQMLADYVQSKMIIRSNLKFPLWIHTHSPIWVLCSYTPILRSEEVTLWRSAKIMHYCDGKHLSIQFNDDRFNNKEDKNLFLDKHSFKMYVEPNIVSFTSSEQRFLIEPFSIYWNEYTKKYFKEYVQHKCVIQYVL